MTKNTAPLLEELPPLSSQLISELDKAYPHRCIGPNEVPEDAHRYAGKREVVDSLLHLMDKTERA